MEAEGTVEELLHQIYYTEKNFDGENALYKKAKLRDKKITYKEVKAWLKKQAVKQQTLTRKVERKEFLPIYSEKSDAFQIDLTFFPKYKKQNKGIYILFTAININTRYVYAYYSQKRTNEDLLSFLKLLTKDTKVNYLSGDLEFKRKDLLKYLEENDIENDFYLADSHKLGIINRFHRTLKGKLDAYFISNNTVKWIDVIDDIIKNYNSTYHTGINVTPKEANENPIIEGEIINERREKTRLMGEKEIIFLIDDKIRVKNKKAVFEKSKATYSHQVYKIVKVNKNTVRASAGDGEKEVTYKKTDITKVDAVENETGNDKIVKAIAEDKAARRLAREGIE